VVVVVVVVTVSGMNAEAVLTSAKEAVDEGDWREGEDAVAARAAVAECGRRSPPSSGVPASMRSGWYGGGA
jgi:hypothetical protein